MNIETTQPGFLNSRNLRLLLGFTIVGVIISMGTYFLAGGFESVSVPATIAILLLGPPLLILTVIGLRQGLSYFAELRAGWTWWHWLFLLLYISTLVFRIRDNQQAESTPVDAWALLRLGPEAIVAAVLLYRLRRGPTSWRHSLSQGLLGILAIYSLVCVVSTVWSIFPTWTLYKAVEFLLDLSALAAFLATVSSEKEIRQLCNLIWFLDGTAIAITWIDAAIWPSECLDELGRLSSYWPVISSNSLGATSAVISIVALARMLAGRPSRSARIWYSLLLVVGLVTLIASQTRNALAGFILGASLVLLFERRVWIASLGAACAVPVLLFTSVGPRVLQFLERDQTESQIVGMSSRVDWWSFAWHQFLQRPLTGFGAYAGGRFAVLGKLGVVASQIHSDYMETLTGVSFWGLVPLVAAILYCWWIIGRSYWDPSLTPDERQWLPEIAGVFAVITVRSFFNVEMIWHAPLLYFAVIAYAEYLRRQRKQRALQFAAVQV